MKPLTAVWVYGSNAPENPQNFDTIRHWWAGLSGKAVTWRQRILEEGGDPRELDWEVERFDEQFPLKDPQVRGITLFWYKPGSEPERSATPRRLELDTLQQALYIFPQSQPEVVIRVALPEPNYQTLKLTNPEVAVETGSGRCTLALTDPKVGVVVRVALNAEGLYALKKQLP